MTTFHELEKLRQEKNGQINIIKNDLVRRFGDPLGSSVFEYAYSNPKTTERQSQLRLSLADAIVTSWDTTDPKIMIRQLSELLQVIKQAKSQPISYQSEIIARRSQ